MYRLHIDIPINVSEEQALKISQEIINFAFDNFQSHALLMSHDIESVNYRLGNDYDRQKSNYFSKNENGHVNNKKSKIVIKTSENSVDSDQE
jgi:hypothetical protein